MSSTYLKKSIATILSFAALGLSMQAGAAGGNNSTFDPIGVVGSGPDYGSPFNDPAFDDPYNYDGDHGGGNEGCDGGCGGGGESASCPDLRMRKPTGCEGYLHLFGAEWGRSLYPSSSGLGKLLSLLNPGAGSLFSPAPYNLQSQPWNMIHDALTRHTQLVTVQTTPPGVANEGLIESVITACALEQQLTGITMTVGGCYEPLRALIAEYNGTANADRNFWEDTGLPYFVIDFFAPDNSLRIKFDAVNTQSKCNVWHQEMTVHGC